MNLQIFNDNTVKHLISKKWFELYGFSLSFSQQILKLLNLKRFLPTFLLVFTRRKSFLWIQTKRIQFCGRVLSFETMHIYSRHTCFITTACHIWVTSSAINRWDWTFFLAATAIVFSEAFSTSQLCNVIVLAARKMKTLFDAEYTSSECFANLNLPGLSGFASGRCSLLTAISGSSRWSQTSNLHLATQLLIVYLPLHILAFSC